MFLTETSYDRKYLEHPNDTFRFYRKNRISKVICQEKHMGSRAIVIICKDTNVVKALFGIAEDRIGICYIELEEFFYRYSDKISIGKSRLSEIFPHLFAVSHLTRLFFIIVILC